GEGPAGRPDYAVNRAADLAAALDRGHEVHRNRAAAGPAADAEGKQSIIHAESGDRQPFGECGFPSIIVGARSQFGDVIRGRVALDRTQLPEVVDCMRGVTCASTNAKDEQPPPALAQLGEPSGDRVDLCGVERPRQLPDSVEIFL